MDKPRIRASSVDILKILEHDINNLLGIVMGYLDLALLEEKGISLKGREGLRMAKSAAEDLSGLIYDFIDAAKKQEENLTFRPGKFDTGRRHLKYVPGNQEGKFKKRLKLRKS